MKSALSYSTLNSQDDTISDSGSCCTNNNGNVYNMDGIDSPMTNRSTTSSSSTAASPHWRIPIQTPIITTTKTGFSPVVAFCFTINYILGTGFLTIPWAFVQSGLILSTLLMILSAIASDIAKDFLLETMARAEVMLDDQMHWIDHHHNNNNNNKNKQQQQQQRQIQHSIQQRRRLLLPPTSKEEREQQRCMIREKQQQQYHDYEEEQQVQEEEEEEELVSYPRQSYDSTGCNITTNTNIMIHGKDKYHRSASAPMDGNSNNTIAMQQQQQQLHVHFDQEDTNDEQQYHHHQQDLTPKYLIEQRKFEVNALCRVYLGRLGLQLYTMVICLYLCGALWAYTSVFSSAMATALPLFEDNESSFNYLCYAILYGCIVVPLSCLELDEQVPLQVFLTICRFLMFFLMILTTYLAAEDELELTTMDSFQKAENFQWSGIAKTLPILVFANIFHHSIPGLSHPVADKRMVGKVFTATNMFTVAAYITLGLTLGAAFGKGIQQSSNLNWRTFHAGTGYIDEHGNVVDAAWWTKLISHYIILFPAVDVVSAYPLNAITLGNNIFGAAYGKRIHEVESNRTLRTCFRLMASIPPIIFGILVRELGTITDYTGTSGFLIGLCFPASLYMASRTKAQQYPNLSLDTYYTSYGSFVPMAKFIFWFGIFMMVFVFTKLTWFSSS